jgi:hypothetical protein
VARTVGDAYSIYNESRSLTVTTGPSSPGQSRAMNPTPAPAQQINVLSHWYAVTDGIQFSAQEFFAKMEDELKARKLPQLKMSRVEYHEGGILSDKRMYLRLARERFAFDLCAAPFGRGFFFSVRLIEKPRGGWVQLLLIIAAIGLTLNTLLLLKVLFWTPKVGMASGLVLIAAGLFVLRPRRAESTAPTSPRAAALFATEVPDFDTFFLNLPVIGAWYEGWRKDTYYRYDTRLLYHTIVSELVKKEVENLTAEKGVKLLNTYDFNPILGELYKRRTIEPGQTSQATPHVADS